MPEDTKQLIEKTATERAEADGIAMVPRHVAIIMDGNNRWAKAKRLPGVAGHRAGVDAVRKVVQACDYYGVDVLTLFAFSSENWQRPAEEVSALMGLFLSVLNKEVKRLHKNNIRLRIVGRRSRFNESIQNKIADAEALTANNTGKTLVIAADYGGRWDILQAAQTWARDLQAGDISWDGEDENVLNRYMCLHDLPEPDLCIRTSGEQRISNFMLWQMAYTEFYFTDTYWPDFDREALKLAFQDYSKRQRRYGGRE